jgi:hypothetical protein
MRVSQETAGHIARALTKKSYEKWQKAKNDVPKAISELYYKKIPVEVAIVLDKHPDWFDWTNIVYIVGAGFGHNDYETSSKQVPRNQCGGYAKMKLTDKEAEALKTLIHNRERLQKEYEDLERETRNSIIALGTHKKIAEHFPQAANLLPTTKAKTFALIPNLEKLTLKLKNQ